MNPKQDTAICKAAQLEVGSELSNLPIVVKWFEQFQGAPLPQATWLQGNMALMEGFTNAVRHAHRSLSPKTLIRLKVEVSDACFQFEIWDQGEPYNFEAAIAQLQKTISDPDFNPLVRERHWGSVVFLNLICKHHWHIDYFRQDDSQNCLRAVVLFPS